MSETEQLAVEPPAPFPVIRGMLRHKRRIPFGGAAALVALGWWLAYRTGLVDLYPIAVVLAAALHCVLRIAVEVVELVAETLMPR
jgi:hypothetical protein